MQVTYQLSLLLKIMISYLDQYVSIEQKQMIWAKASPQFHFFVPQNLLSFRAIIIMEEVWSFHFWVQNCANWCLCKLCHERTFTLGWPKHRRMMFDKKKVNIRRHHATQKVFCPMQYNYHHTLTISSSSYSKK